MAAWHRSRRADVGLRVSGLLLCGVCYAAIWRLVAMHVPAQSAGALASALAATAFLAASAGSAMLTMGTHLFDVTDVGPRWRGRGYPVFMKGTPGMSEDTGTEPAMLVVGRDVDGSWAVRESAGRLLGRFPSAQAAERFARAERGGVSAISIATSAGSARRLQGRLTLNCQRECAIDRAHG